jgi:hypothetical protein
MPYIKQEDRERLANGGVPQNPGELNYWITVLLKEYIRVRGLSYQTINDILGVLDGASKEFYQRVARPYEDKKIQENGDVY